MLRKKKKKDFIDDICKTGTSSGLDLFWGNPCRARNTTKEEYHCCRPLLKSSDLHVYLWFWNLEKLSKFCVFAFNKILK